MIDKQTLFEIHRLRDAGLSLRQIAHKVKLTRITVKKYLFHPEQVVRDKGKKSSKLDDYHEVIDQFLAQEPDVKAPVVWQRLAEKGFDGKLTIVRDYLRQRRGSMKSRQAYIRFESLPGKQIQVDWAHFSTLSYEQTQRKLYCLAMVECYSRMLYVEFTHSQKQETLHRCFLNGFKFFGGTPGELVVDNMLTAVTERHGALIRFNDAFLDFLRPLKIVPIACNVRAPHEKGKVEKVIDYIRINFWPLRNFKDLSDVNHQAMDWLVRIANIRIHQTTGEQPIARFASVKLRPLPELLPDCRETATLKVHKDFAVRFDGNAYTVCPWTVGNYVTVKADETTVTIYDRQNRLATHPRCWERKKRIELPQHVEQVQKLQKKQWQDQEIAVFISLGAPTRQYLEGLADAGVPIKKTVSKLLALKDEYGAQSVIYAVEKAITHKAYGAEYIENILYQEMTPKNHHLPVRLKDEALNRIRLTEPCLADYDAYIIKRSKNND